MKYLTYMENLCRYVLYEFPSDNVILEYCSNYERDAEPQGKKDEDMIKIIKKFSEDQFGF
jgi:hypothetical protein